MCQSFNLPINIFDRFFADRILGLPFASQYFVYVNLLLPKERSKPKPIKSTWAKYCPVSSNDCRCYLESAIAGTICWWQNIASVTVHHSSIDNFVTATLYRQLLVQFCTGNCWCTVVPAIAGAILSQDLLVQPCTGNCWFNLFTGFAGTRLLVQPCTSNCWYDLVSAFADTNFGCIQIQVLQWYSEVENATQSVS